MDAHAQRQAILAAGLGPLAHDVALGSHVHGVPGLVLAVPEVEVVVVVGQGHEELGSHALVEADERVGLPPLGFPLADDILEAEVLGVAILLEVHFLLPLSGVIHVAGIPVACLRLALRPPVGPDAETSRPDTSRGIHSWRVIPRWVGICPAPWARTSLPAPWRRDRLPGWPGSATGGWKWRVS